LQLAGLQKTPKPQKRCAPALYKRGNIFLEFRAIDPTAAKLLATARASMRFFRGSGFQGFWAFRFFVVLA
jgi:hypothetical protein